MDNTKCKPTLWNDGRRNVYCDDPGVIGAYKSTSMRTRSLPAQGERHLQSTVLQSKLVIKDITRTEKLTIMNFRVFHYSYVIKEQNWHVHGQNTCYNGFLNAFHPFRYSEFRLYYVYYYINYYKLHHTPRRSNLLAD